MINDITPAVNTWVDVYAASGFPVGTRLLLQNKRGGSAYFWEGASAPVGSPTDSVHGYELCRLQGPAKTSSGIAGLWVYCWEPSGSTWTTGRICVQEYIP